ncbi:hypothetical protein BsWGS_00532 [Bradybaena similaris]
MAAIGARASIKQAIKPHIPLIKFPSRGSTPASKDHATAVEKPQAFDQILNSVIAKPRTESKQGTKPLDASQVPQKYRRKLLTKEEMEIIEKGGRL